MLAYFDCFSGISGDMTLGALVDAGADARELTGRLALLGVDGYEISFEKVDRSGISATRASPAPPSSTRRNTAPSASSRSPT